MSAVAALLDTLTVWEARKVLERPVFGDTRCIQAVRLLSLLEDSADLLASHASKPGALKYPCPCCETRGSAYCDDCGRDSYCHHCDVMCYIDEELAEDLNFMLVCKMHEIALREYARS